MKKTDAVLKKLANGIGASLSDYPSEHRYEVVDALVENARSEEGLSYADTARLVDILHELRIV